MVEVVVEVWWWWWRWWWWCRCGGGGVVEVVVEVWWKCKEDISPYNKSIRADLSEILWPSYVSLVTFCPVLLLATTWGPYKDKTQQPPLLPGGLSNGLIYPLSIVSKNNHYC